MKKTSKKKPATVLILRTTDAEGKSFNGFQWPEKGEVRALDWDPKPECGHGLHGLLWGAGAGNLLNWSEDARWLVVEVLTSEVVKIDDQKVKFPRGTVVFCGKRDDAVKMVAARAPTGTIIVAGTATAGYAGTATAGYAGTATAGYAGTATAGNYGTATAGEAGILTLRWWDGKRYRIGVFYVGEDGVLPNTKYKLNDQGKLVKAAS